MARRRRRAWLRSLAPVFAIIASAAVAQPAPVAPSFGHYQPARQFTEQARSTFYLPMRDGVRLAVTVARPARGGQPADGQFPVIWHHTLSATPDPADGTGPRAAGFRAIPNLTDYGYVVVQVARRGNGQSFGERRGYQDRNEAQDAYDLTQWLAAQPWSNGVVGMYGCSNTGDAAMQAVSMRPPALKAVFAGCFSWHKYDAFRRGGIFAQWGTGPTRTVDEDMRQQPVDADPDKRLLRQAAEEHQRSTPLLEMWKQLPYRDSFSSLVVSRFWAEGSVASYRDQVRRSGVALYIVGGWFDELRDQGLITSLNVPGSRIVIGPWKHCTNDGFALVEEAHRFFDEKLKGLDAGLSRDDPIHYFTINAGGGAGEWRSTRAWPLSAASGVSYRFGAQGLAASGEPMRPLSAAFTVDYKVACPDAGSGATVQPCHIPGGGISKATPVLARDTEVTGQGIADLWIASTAPDANIFLYLEDVAPDGTIRVVTEGRLKASLRKLGDAPWVMLGTPWHRAYAEDAQPLVPGQPGRLTFDLLPTSYVFRRGHRIQFTVTGSDHRERARDEQPVPPRITVLSDSAHPSAVTLPVVR